MTAGKDPQPAVALAKAGRTDRAANRDLEPSSSGSVTAFLAPLQASADYDLLVKVKKPSRKPAKPPSPKQEDAKGAPKSSYDLAMERLRAADRASGTAEAPLSPARKKDIAQARAVATSRLAEREILFRDAMQKTNDPVEREKAEHEYQTDRRRINDDLESALESIRRGP